jgi:hypothetical protein
MAEYTQLGTTGLVSPMTKSLFGVQKKRNSEQDRHESNHRRRKEETEQKEERDQIVLSRDRDQAESVRPSDDEAAVDYGTEEPNHQVRKKVDLVI